LLVSENRILVSAPPEAVFAMLGDAYRYAEWVVGAQEIRGVAGDWPSPGSRFFHSVGAGPFTLDDHTEVIEADPPRRLVLEARVRPLLTASVTLTVTQKGEGSEVVMEEHPTGPSPMRVIGPLLDPFTFKRNMTALKRLKDLVEHPSSS
jgi:uncharacterized protein YndB with AHSA1/START domain